MKPSCLSVQRCTGAFTERLIDSAMLSTRDRSISSTPTLVVTAWLSSYREIDKSLATV
ncbi:hypothetical protein DMV94_10145 [Vibrio parahaemolyticus]|nr:hypothetical protein [Vibrio parahaemolyticus]EGR3040801.1 hypothetical protein [Vibrio parahaemolyticus]